MANWLKATCTAILMAMSLGQDQFEPQFDDPMTQLLPLISTNTQFDEKSENIRKTHIDFDKIDEYYSEIDEELSDEEGEAEEESQLLNNEQHQPSSEEDKPESDGDPVIISEDKFDGNKTITIENKPHHKDSSSGQCSYTFVIPQNPNLCVNSKPTMTTQNDDYQFLVELQREVFVAKTQIENIRNEMVEERTHIPSARIVKSIQDDVSQLQREVLVLNNRAQQINLQVSEQIVSRRDNTIELQQLENKLLNQTLQYYVLKEAHEQLKHDHNALRAAMIDQSEQLGSLREAVEELTIKGRPGMNQVIPIQATQPDHAIMKQSWQHNEGKSEMERVTTSHSPQPKSRLISGPFRDCTDAQRAGHTISGIFYLRLPKQRKKMKVWCDFDQDPGGWITIQRREDNKVDFYRNMASYKRGFGKLRKNFWLGLENIHKLTNQSEVNYKLHIDMEDWGGRRTFVEYRSFRVEGDADGYKLKITHYSGNAGDALTAHNNMKFTTRDEDNDIFHQNCADIAHGGWWYTACGYSNLNGFYYREGEYRRDRFDGIYWSEWKGRWYSLKSVSMKIRPTE